MRVRGTHIDGLRVDRLVPRGVEVPDAARDVGAVAVARGDGGVVLADPVVDRIDRFDVFLEKRETRIRGSVRVYILKRARVRILPCKASAKACRPSGRSQARAPCPPRSPSQSA